MTASRPSHSGVMLGGRHVSSDAISITTLMLLVGLLCIERLWGGVAITRLDSFTFFIPMYGYLGDQLAQGNIPGWNPYQFGGSAFAGDPESGWMYLPAMTLFALLEPALAFKLLAAFHLVIAALSMYVLTRTLGLGAFGSLGAALAFVFGILTEFTGCCTVYAQAMVWIPLALLGVEKGFRADSWLIKSSWWVVAGLSLSQTLMGWFGQGAYYGGLFVTAFIVWRGFIAVPEKASLLRRAMQTLAAGTLTVNVAIGFAAAGILPRLDNVSRSTLAGGNYSEFAAHTTGTSPFSTSALLARILSVSAGDSRYYAGGAILALALAGTMTILRHTHLLFFGIAAVTSFSLAIENSPLLAAFQLLPQFSEIHSHLQYRVLMVFYISVAILAGAALDSFLNPSTRRIQLICCFIPVSALLAYSAWAAPPKVDIEAVTIIAILCVLVAIVVLVATRSSGMATAVACLLCLVIVTDPIGIKVTGEWNERRDLDDFAERVMDRHTTPSPAALFLMSQDPLRMRYFGYELGVRPGYRGTDRFNGQYAGAIQSNLIVNNRGLYLGMLRCARL